MNTWMKKRKTARVAVIQYKMWDGHSFHQDPRLLKQTARLKKFACVNRLCDPDWDDRRTYRLPNCAAFLRPTDRLQNPDSLMISSGLHIPLCVVEASWETNQNQGRSVRKPQLEDRSLSHRVFEELFNCRMVGSKEVKWDDLETIYKELMIFEHDESIILHAQEFDI